MKISDTKTEWAKIGTINSLFFLGKDIICFGSGCHLIFINLNNGHETIYTVNNIENGDGIKCFKGHRFLPLFAFAENRCNPRIFVHTYPTLQTVNILKDENIEEYLYLAFSETSLLFALGGLPNYLLTVWNWRKPEKFASQETRIFSPEQMIRSSLNNPPIVAQLELGTDKLYIWDVFTCVNKCIVTEHKAKLSSKINQTVQLKSILWTTEGGLFTLDTNGCVYVINCDYELERVIENPATGNGLTSFVWYKGGLAIAGPDKELRHYKKMGNWFNDWIITLSESTKMLIANRGDCLLNLSNKNNIIQLLSDNNWKYVKINESQFIDFALIYPKCEYVVALCYFNTLVVYAVETGEIKDQMLLNGKALVMKQNPEFPYVSVGFENGMLQLISVSNNSKLSSMAFFHLSHNSITSIYFTDNGRVFVAANKLIGEFFVLEGLPGGIIEVIASVQAQRQIVDYILVSSRTCYRLFIIPVTTKENLAGNIIIRYCIVKNEIINIKTYKLENHDKFYDKLCATMKPDRDRIFYAIPFAERYIHKLETKRGDPLVRLLDKIPTGHQLKNVNLSLNKYHSVTCSYDGFIIVRNTDFNEFTGLILSHHRKNCGVKRADVSHFKNYVVSLGHDNVLTCTRLLNNDIDADFKDEIYKLADSKNYLFQKRTIGFLPEGKFKGLCWLEFNEFMQKEKERVQCEIERNLIVKEFKLIQNELQQLLTENIEGPDNEKLDILEFNLDDEIYNTKVEKNKEICKATEIYFKELIIAQNNITKWLMETFWNKMTVTGQIIEAIYGDFNVDNYVLIARTQKQDEKIQWAQEQRKIEQYLTGKNNIFEPWVPANQDDIVELSMQKPTLFEETQQFGTILVIKEREDEETKTEFVDTKLAMAGCDTQTFIETCHYNYPQIQIATFWQNILQSKISEYEAYQLKEYFNKEFNSLMSQKQREMSVIKERNARLRHIISEINYFSNTKISITITDPEWKQEETPELLTNVNDEEVSITPYISPSQQKILDEQTAEAERIRLLLLADDFRERALMIMMNGVLEVRWEDELKKDVPLPKCMIDKPPEQYNEDDLRAVRDYEEKVKFLNSERERYKKLLYKEYEKVSNLVREGVGKFNERLSALLLLKMKIESAIIQENLKINRAKLMQHKRLEFIKKSLEIKQFLIDNESTVHSLQELVLSLQETLHEHRNYVDSYQAREKFLEKAFKKEFQDATPALQEQALKLYKKRPKMNYRVINTASILTELARCVISKEKSLTLTTECLEYLKSLDNVDMYIGISSIIDENNFAIICKHRRQRIELEVKEKKNYIINQTAENTISVFQKRLAQKKDKFIKLSNELSKIRTDMLDMMRNIELQLVLKRGIVEIPLTGQINDFENAVLICRKDVEDINQIILDAGDKKLHAMKQTMTFRRGIVLMEWEHKKLRMQIEDLKQQIQDIEKIKVTKEIQAYLKSKAKGYAAESDFETEVNMIKASYENIIKEKQDKVEKIQKQLQVIRENTKSVDKKIADINVDVCEYNLEKDHELKSREEELIETRMATFLTRNQLVQTIQQNHNDILVLQTELELLRLKTYPTLKYKVPAK